MKNNALNGLVAIILGLIFFAEVYVSVGLTIYGLWLATKVLKNKQLESKRNRIIAIITMMIGYPLIIFLFYYFFTSVFWK